MVEKIWKFIEYNRFVFIGLLTALVLGLYAISCTPITDDPVNPQKQVDAQELQESFEVWQAEQNVIAKRFELSGKDLERQAENNAKIEKFIIDLAAGGIADLPGVITLLIGGGALGAIGDNIRKRGLIAGLKRHTNT